MMRPRLSLLVYRDDAEQESADDSDFSAALVTKATERGQLSLNLKEDWASIFP